MNLNMVSLIDIFIHVQCLITANNFNMLASVNREFKQELDFSNLACGVSLPYNVRKFFQRSRELMAHSSPYNFFVFGTNFTHVCTSYDFMARAKMRNDEECKFSVIGDGVRRSKGVTVRTSMTFREYNPDGWVIFEKSKIRYELPENKDGCELRLVGSGTVV